VEVDQIRVSDEFGTYWDNKIKTALDKISIEDEAYNGRRLVHLVNKMFLQESDIWECMKMLKANNSEGFVIIPQIKLKDGKVILIKLLAGLFEFIKIRPMFQISG
jgi:hypothetical protein